MAKVKYTNNFKEQLDNLIDFLGSDAPGVIYKAEAVTLKRVAVTARAEVTKIARQKLALQGRPGGRKIKAAQFKKEFTSIDLKLPKRGGGSVAVIVKGKPVSMSRFLSSPKKVLKQKGVKVSKRRRVRVEVFKGKKTTLKATSKSPFVFRDSRGRLQVGKRRSVSVRKRRRDGQMTDVHVRNLTGASIATFFRTLNVKDKIEKKMAVQFQVRFRNRFEFFAQQKIKSRLRKNLKTRFK